MIGAHAGAISAVMALANAELDGEMAPTRSGSASQARTKETPAMILYLLRKCDPDHGLPNWSFRDDGSNPASC
jgi:hypothetical protein